VQEAKKLKHRERVERARILQDKMKAGVIPPPPNKGHLRVSFWRGWREGWRRAGRASK